MHSVFEQVTRSNDEASSRAARHVIRFLLSPLWELQFEWYWKSDEGRNIFGQYWIEANRHSVQQLRETPEGRDFINWAVDTGWLVDCLFMPEPNPNQTTEEADQNRSRNRRVLRRLHGGSKSRHRGRARHRRAGTRHHRPGKGPGGGQEEGHRLNQPDLQQRRSPGGRSTRGGRSRPEATRANRVMRLEIKLKPAKADLRNGSSKESHIGRKARSLNILATCS